MLQEVHGCPAKTAISAISATPPKIVKIGEITVFTKINLSQVLQELMSSKNRDFSKNCEKIGEITVFTKINLSKNRDFSKNCEKIGEITVFAKIN